MHKGSAGTHSEAPHGSAYARQLLSLFGVDLQHRGIKLPDCALSRLLQTRACHEQQVQRADLSRISEEACLTNASLAWPKLSLCTGTVCVIACHLLVGEVSVEDESPHKELLASKSRSVGRSPLRQRQRPQLYDSCGGPAGDLILITAGVCMCGNHASCLQTGYGLLPLARFAPVTEWSAAAELNRAHNAASSRLASVFSQGVLQEAGLTISTIIRGQFADLCTHWGP